MFSAVCYDEGLGIGTTFWRLVPKEYGERWQERTVVALNIAWGVFAMLVVGRRYWRSGSHVSPAGD